MSTVAALAAAPVAPAAAVAASGRLPDFILIGAAKCGTTTLHRWLGLHSHLFLCTPKEPQFFSDDDVHARGAGWYRRLFAGAADHQRCGEASTTYTRWPHTADAAPRIAALVPDARLVYIMRHPVERSYSHYAHWMRDGVTKTFEAALDEGPELVDCSLYAEQLDRHRRHFPDDRILLLLLEDLRRDPRAVLRRIQRFLDVPEIDLLASDPPIANRRGNDHYLRRCTTEPLRRLPGAAAVIDRVPKAWRRAGFDVLRRSPIGRVLARRHRLPPMRPDTRAMLLDRFRETTDQIEHRLGRRLPAWRV